MLEEKINLYIEEVREKNKDKSIDYNKLIAKCPFITNKKELDIAKNKLEELDKDNLEFYNHIIDLIKDENTDLNSLYLLYKEYNDVELIRDLLATEIYNKEMELDSTKKSFNKDSDSVSDIEKEVKELKSMGNILDNLSSTVSINLDDLFLKIEREEAKKLGFGMKALLAIGSFLSFKNNKNILGTVLASYLSYKVISELTSSSKNNYIDLCEEYITTLEGYKDDLEDLEKNLVGNLDNIESLEKNLKDKYKAYLEEREFKNLFSIIDKIKDSVKSSLKDVDKSLDNANRSIDESKVKVKRLEE